MWNCHSDSLRGEDASCQRDTWKMRRLLKKDVEQWSPDLASVFGILFLREEMKVDWDRRERSREDLNKAFRFKKSPRESLTLRVGGSFSGEELSPAELSVLPNLFRGELGFWRDPFLGVDFWGVSTCPCRWGLLLNPERERWDMGIPE